MEQDEAKVHAAIRSALPATTVITIAHNEPSSNWAEKVVTLAPPLNK
jgi:ABC-type uncharacterized transport system fused permease/ATPase subunit